MINSNRFFSLIFLWCLANVILCQGVLAEESERDIKEGEKLYLSKCTSCHSFDNNMVGPMLRGIFGNKAGGVKGYAYSKSLLSSGVTWDAATLDKYLADPLATVPGTKMIAAYKDSKERGNIITFLQKMPDSDPAIEAKSLADAAGPKTAAIIPGATNLEQHPPVEFSLGDAVTPPKPKFGTAALDLFHKLIERFHQLTSRPSGQ